MRKKYKMNLLRAGMVTGLVVTGMLAGIFTGCGDKEKVDYSIEGVEDAAASEEQEYGRGKSSVAQFAKETHWSDVWTLETKEGIGTETVEITIEADIFLPDAEEMYVVEVTVPEMDEPYRQRIVENLFDSQEVSHMTAKDEVKEEELYPTKGDYVADQYIGERDGVSYILWFNRITDEDMSGGYSSQWFNFYPEDTSDICPKSYEGYTRFMPHRFLTVDKYTRIGENECAISQEKAQEMAEDFLKEFELEYSVLHTVRPLIWGDDTLSSDTIYDWPANGYVFTYHYGVEEVSFRGSTKYAYMPYAEEDTDKEYPAEGSAEVYVTERGVICMYADNPVETMGMSGEVEFLPLETIKEIMKEEVIKRYEEFSFVHLMPAKELQFTRMDLIYFRVRDKEHPGSYSYIPAWRLSEDLGKLPEGGDIVVHNPVIINAIDGTLINFYDET